MASDDGRNWDGRNWLDISHAGFLTCQADQESGGVRPGGPTQSSATQPLDKPSARVPIQEELEIKLFFLLTCAVQASKQANGRQERCRSRESRTVGNREDKGEGEGVNRGGGFELIDMTKLRCPDALTL